MERRAAHAVTAQLTHDEIAHEAFLVDFRREVVRQWQVDLRKLSEVCGAQEKSRRDILRNLLKQGAGQLASSMRTVQQEMAWDVFGASVERQVERLTEAAAIAHPVGSLTLDAGLELPSYLSAVDIHGMPGGYGAALVPEGVFAGALYELGGTVRSMRAGGVLANASGRALVSLLRTEYPDFRPTRILDVGCAIGQSTLAICDAFPDAEVHAIDVAAPLLRYGHARADSLGRKVHFSQQNAERTRFEDGSFDLVAGLAMLHETSTKAMREILRESHRLLRSGGIVLHYEGRPWASINAYDAAIHDWDTHYNAEPFIGKMHEIDTRAMMAEVGFDPACYIEVTVPSDFYGTTASKNGGRWFFGAIKS